MVYIFCKARTQGERGESLLSANYGFRNITVDLHTCKHTVQLKTPSRKSKGRWAMAILIQMYLGDSYKPRPRVHSSFSPHLTHN